MSDLFHKDVPWDFVDRVFDVMEQADWHIFQVLTKRSASFGYGLHIDRVPWQVPDSATEGGPLATPLLSLTCPR